VGPLIVSSTGKTSAFTGYLVVLSPKSQAPELRQPQQARSRKTRERIVRAAEHLFESKGYEPTTSGAIARRAGVSVGAFYLYFPDKHAILMEIFHQTAEQIFGRAMEGLRPEHWQKTDLREGIRALIGSILDSRDLRPGIQRIFQERYFKDEAIKSAVDRMQEESVGAILKLMEVLSGRVRVRDREAAAFLVYVAVDALALRVMLAETPFDPDRLTLELTDLIARYILNE
jgi:AcrR family transcriptional regulator